MKKTLKLKDILIESGIVKEEMSKEQLYSYYDLEPSKVKENPDGSIDYDGNVTIMATMLKKLNIKFGVVKGDFKLKTPSLDTLEGCPKEVTGNFNCSVTSITSLKDGPEKVGKNYECSQCKLKTLEGAPDIIKGDFFSTGNQLTDLKGAPREVGGSFVVDNNKLTTLQGAPKKVGKSFSAMMNGFKQSDEQWAKNNIKAGSYNVV